MFIHQGDDQGDYQGNDQSDDTLYSVKYETYDS